MSGREIPEWVLDYLLQRNSGNNLKVVGVISLAWRIGLERLAFLKQNNSSTMKHSRLAESDNKVLNSASVDDHG